jgi:hypothetical protein
MLRRKDRKIISHSTCVVTQLIYSRLLHHNSPKRKNTCWLTFPFQSRNKQACVETVPCSVFARFNLRSDFLFYSSHYHLPLYSRINFQWNSLLATDRSLCGLVSGRALEAVGWLFAASLINCLPPCDVAKKCHSAVILNPSSWWYWLTQFYRFLCCASTPLLT